MATPRTRKGKITGADGKTSDVEIDLEIDDGEDTVKASRFRAVVTRLQNTEAKLREYEEADDGKDWKAEYETLAKTSGESAKNFADSMALSDAGFKSADEREVILNRYRKVTADVPEAKRPDLAAWLEKDGKTDPIVAKFAPVAGSGGGNSDGEKGKSEPKGSEKSAEKAPRKPPTGSEGATRSGQGGGRSDNFDPDAVAAMSVDELRKDMGSIAAGAGYSWRP